MIKFGTPLTDCAVLVRAPDLISPKMRGKTHGATPAPGGLPLARTLAVMVRAYRRSIDAVVFVATVSAMIAGVAYLNDDLRRQFADVLAGDRSSQAAVVAASFARLTRPVVETFQMYWSVNPWMVGFAVVSLVMFLFIYKT